MPKALIFTFAVLLAVTAVACGDGAATDTDTDADQAADVPEVAAFPGMPLAGELQTTDSGLQYFVLEEGDGPLPAPPVRVTVHYSGYLLSDGTKFDSSVDKGVPFTFNLGVGGVIQGWDEGVALMKVGGTHKLIIPPELGYGEGGSPPVIPPGATLVFDVELLELP